MSEPRLDIRTDVIDLHRQFNLQDITVRPRVVLRPMMIEDAPGMLAVLEADPEIRKRVSAAAGMTDTAGVQREIEEYQVDPGLIRYTIHSDDKVAGLVSLWTDEGFFGQPAQPNTYGFGYFLHPGQRGKGLVGDSVQKLMDVSRATVRVDSFIAFCEDDNPKSIAVLTKLGFKPTNDTFTEPTYGWVERKYEKRVNGDQK